MAKLTYINLGDIDLPEFESHNQTNESDILELSESIKVMGVIEPLIVRKINKRFEIVAGCLRYRAAQIAGLKSVPCIIHSLDDQPAELIKIHENIKRVPLDHVDQGLSFLMMIDKFSLTQEDISKIIGKSISYISNHIALVTQDDVLSTAVKNNTISFSQARELLNVKEIATRRQLQKYCEKDGATIQVLRSWIKEHNDQLITQPKTETSSNDITYHYTKPSYSKPCEACHKSISISDIRQIILCPTCCQAIKDAILAESSKSDSKLSSNTS